LLASDFIKYFHAATACDLHEITDVAILMIEVYQRGNFAFIDAYVFSERRLSLWADYLRLSWSPARSAEENSRGLRAVISVQETRSLRRQIL
jgi:hypothetical protein